MNGNPVNASIESADLNFSFALNAHKLIANRRFNLNEKNTIFLFDFVTSPDCQPGQRRATGESRRRSDYFK